MTPTRTHLFTALTFLSCAKEKAATRKHGDIVHDLTCVEQLIKAAMPQEEGQ